ncbi:MAG TPA: thiamine-phosphate kinase, partial [Dehalococcoidia bacterium]|nr:thiamine-phosphate kinase [Dehalococcoidia bacterium]
MGTYNRGVLVSEIGEFGLIRLLAQEFGIEYPPVRGALPDDGLMVGLGDDAVVTARRDGSLIWTTDTMVAGVHFLPGQSPWRDTGWKALAVNLSDIAAMGGTPYLALVTLTLPPAFSVEDAVELYRGLHEAASAFDVTLGGGDIVRSPVFSITVALSGWAQTPRLGEAQVLTRGAARPGDVVAVSGTLGNSAGGVQLLTIGCEFKNEAEKYLRAAQQRPQPKVAMGQAAVRAGLRCGIDVSDGLVQDLGHVATASNVTILIDAVRVPTSDALRELFPAEALGLALNGGEDYELLVVGPRQAVDVLIETSETPVTMI